MDRNQGAWGLGLGGNQGVWGLVLVLEGVLMV